MTAGARRGSSRWPLPRLAPEARPEGDLSGYRVVLASPEYLVDGATVAVLRDFVAGGGFVVVTHCSGSSGDSGRLLVRESR